MSETRRPAPPSSRSRALLPVCIAAAVALGSVPLPFRGVVASLLSALGLGRQHADATGEIILWSVRLPRVLLAALVGGGLAVVGACLQSVFRNPMADSGLLGVTAARRSGRCWRCGWAGRARSSSR